MGERDGERKADCVVCRKIMKDTVKGISEYHPSLHGNTRGSLL